MTKDEQPGLEEILAAVRDTLKGDPNQVDLLTWVVATAPYATAEEHSIFAANVERAHGSHAACVVFASAVYILAHYDEYADAMAPLRAEGMRVMERMRTMRAAHGKDTEGTSD